MDSFPLPVCQFGRAPYCHSFRGDGTEYGYCPSKKETYFGDKGYVSQSLKEELKNQNIDLISLKHSNSKEYVKPSIRQLIFRFRRNIMPISVLLPNGVDRKKTKELSQYFVYTHTKTIRSSFLPPAPVFLFPVFFDKC